jgi:RNA polymerase sigma-70 factor, ECF subfamily
MTDDSALLRAAAAGDAGAYAQFMRAHQGAVHRYLATYTGSDDVDDALQETFINAWRGAPGYHGGTSARAWLYTIARHVVHHAVRRRVDEPDELESLETLAEAAGWGCIDARSGGSGSDDGIARELLTVALSQLPREEREVLTLRELDGFSGEETAAILQLSLAAMKSRLHRARIHLAAIVRRLEAPADAGGRPT